MNTRTQPSIDQLLADGVRLTNLLPTTMQPGVHRQLDRWPLLFAFEQQSVERLLRGLLATSGLEEQFRPLRALEEKMGVRQWKFNAADDTMENASLLARSAYYADWRAEVRRVTTAIEQNAPPEDAHWQRPRLLITILPSILDYRKSPPWAGWGIQATELHFSDDLRSLLPGLLCGTGEQPGLSSLSANDPAMAREDLWCIDAASYLHTIKPPSLSALSLSDERMKDFREEFLAAANAVPKNIEVSDQILGSLRKRDWTAYCPQELVQDQRLRAFMVDLFLSGNGATIYANSYVEWVASEAMRRARPRMMIARFGTRSKPKPFTGIAIFENQQRISTLPDVEDLEGSAIDAQILAKYLWLNAKRYAEQSHTACLCLCEAANAAYLDPPPGADLSRLQPGAVSTQELHRWLMEYLQA